jgi:hypothetical protein
MMQSNQEPNHYRNGNAGVPAYTNGGGALVPVGNGIMEPAMPAPAGGNDGGGQVDPKESQYADLALIAPNHIESQTGRLSNALDSAPNRGQTQMRWILCKD